MNWSHNPLLAWPQHSSCNEGQGLKGLARNDGLLLNPRSGSIDLWSLVWINWHHLECCGHVMPSLQNTYNKSKIFTIILFLQIACLNPIKWVWDIFENVVKPSTSIPLPASFALTPACKRSGEVCLDWVCLDLDRVCLDELRRRSVLGRELCLDFRWASTLTVASYLLASCVHYSRGYRQLFFRG